MEGGGRVGVASGWDQQDIKVITALFMMLFISAVGLRRVRLSAWLLPLYMKPAVDLRRHVLLITGLHPQTLPELLPVLRRPATEPPTSPVIFLSALLYLTS